MERFGEYEIKEKICKRDSTEIFLVEKDGEEFCLKLHYDDPRWGIGDVKKAYRIYDELKDKSGLVKVFEHGIRGSSYFIVMEYLKGYKRIEFSETFLAYEKMKQIENNLLRQNVIQADFVPINFMVKDGHMVMIDLDKLFSLPDLQFAPKKAGQALTWYGYSVARTKICANRLSG